MVLPEPVRDWPTTSRPASSGGIARSWISVGVSMPMTGECAHRMRAGAEFGEGRGWVVVAVAVVVVAVVVPADSLEGRNIS